METAEHTAEQISDGTLALPERLVPPTERGQRLFRGALVVALFLHAMLFVEVGRSIPRSIGDRSGSPDAIAVDLVTEADLKSRESVALPPAGAPAPQPPPQPQAQEEAQKPAEPAPPTPQPEAKPEPEPPPKAEEPQKTESAPKPAEAPKAEKTEETSKSETPSPLPDFSSSLPDLASIPQPQEEAKPEPEENKPEEPQPKEEPKRPEPVQKREASPAKKQAQKQARLEPQTPDMQSAPPGRSASATRPPGITRSGENDEFGRGVVRALRMTMPPPRGILGRVTVRLLLTENGDLAEVQVLQPSGTPIDQSVVFATKQTYFPLPPYNSSVADRTFIITYVYR